MPTKPLTDEHAQEAVDAVASFQSQTAAAAFLNIPRGTLQHRLRVAAERGLVAPGTKTMPGYRIDSLTETPNGTYIKQRKEHGEQFAPTLPVKGRTTLIDAEGRIITQHIMERATAESQAAAFAAAVEAIKEDLPRVTIMPAPAYSKPDLLNQFTVTDNHFGMLAHAEETGADYDLKIAEQLLLDWFASAIDCAPAAHTAVLAQLGDLLHHDSLESVTPAHRHVLDADSRLHKVIRVVIRTFRRIIDMLLQKHKHVHVVMASGNHDPASSVWVRELLATIYENEPRISVDVSPKLYYSFEWGKTGLYYHHMHKRGVKDLDRVFAGMFREMYGRCEFNYGHGGHLHSDAVVSTQLMHIERHETLAAPDAYAAGGGWLSGRSAKIITYSKDHGEVGRLTLRPAMVAGASRAQAARLAAANDNEPRRAAA